MILCAGMKILYFGIGRAKPDAERPQRDLVRTWFGPPDVGSALKLCMHKDARPAGESRVILGKLRRGSGRQGNPQAARDSYQICKRVRTHFAHYTSAVDFYSNLAGSDIGGNLLVQPARYDQREQLLFAGCERLKTLPQSRDLAELLTRCAVAFERDLNGVEKLLVAKRLG